MEEVNLLATEQLRRLAADYLRCYYATHFVQPASSFRRAAEAADGLKRLSRLSIPQMRRFNRKAWSIVIQSMRDELAKLRKEHGRAACRRRNRLRREIREAHRARRGTTG